MPPYVNMNASGSGDASTSRAHESATVPKLEDVTMAVDLMNPGPVPDIPQEAKPSLYAVYNSATEIPYQPEAALKEGVGMVNALKASIKKLELGSKLRKDVWLREIERFVVCLPTSDYSEFFSLAFRTRERLPLWLPFVEVCAIQVLSPLNTL